MILRRVGRGGWVLPVLLGCGQGSSGEDGDTSTGTGDASEATAAASQSSSAMTASSSSGPSSTSADTTSGSDESSGTAASGSTGGPTGSGLGIDGEQLTWNGVPTFFIGVSYFDARNWHDEDFEGLASRGWNLVRIWLDWGDATLFGADGALTTDGAEALGGLVDAAGARQMVVDVTILAPALTFPADTDHRVVAVQSAASLLLDRNNVLYDVMNEHDHGDGPIEHAEAAAIVVALREVDAEAIVTISSTGGHLVGSDAAVQTENVDAEIDEVGVAIVTPHLPRTPDWADQTDVRVTALRGHLQTRGLTMPIYLQEEARRGHSGLDPTDAEFIQAATEAASAGAAAWIFHTDAGYDLAASTFFDALDPVEVVVVDMLPGSL
jgi:hypothetical protein